MNRAQKIILSVGITFIVFVLGAAVTNGYVGQSGGYLFIVVLGVITYILFKLWR